MYILLHSNVSQMLQEAETMVETISSAGNVSSCCVRCVDRLQLPHFLSHCRALTSCDGHATESTSYLRKYSYENVHVYVNKMLPHPPNFSTCGSFFINVHSKFTPF